MGITTVFPFSPQPFIDLSDSRSLTLPFLYVLPICGNRTLYQRRFRLHEISCRERVSGLGCGIDAGIFRLRYFASARSECRYRRECGKFGDRAERCSGRRISHRIKLAVHDHPFSRARRPRQSRAELPESTEKHYYQVRDGKATLLDQKVRFAEGVDFDPNGRIIMKDGTLVKLREHEMVTFSGERRDVPLNISMPKALPPGSAGAGR